MQTIKVGDTVQVDGYETEYEVAGRDRAGRIWLSATDPEYDGYDGDLILYPVNRGWQQEKKDERSMLADVITLSK